MRSSTSFGSAPPGCFFHLKNVDAGGLPVDVLDGDLRLAVGAQERKPALAARGRQFAREAVRVHDRRRHELGRFS